MRTLNRIHPKDIKFVSLSLKAQGHSIIFTNGCFDVLHLGHVRLLQAASLMSNMKLIIGINSDASVQRLKGPTRPIHCLEERIEMLLALQCVERVTWFDEDTPLQLIEEIRPDILLKGGDYSEEKIVGYDFVKSYGGLVTTIPVIAEMSSTRILDRLLRED